MVAIDECLSEGGNQWHTQQQMRSFQHSVIVNITTFTVLFNVSSALSMHTHIPAIHAVHRNTRISPRLRGNELDEQRCMLMQLSVTERRTMFRETLILQATSPNFVFYDCYTGEVVEFPFPIYDPADSREHGERIMPAKMKDYHASRRQNYECWCGLYSPEVPCWVEMYTRNGLGCLSCVSVCIDSVYESATEMAVYQGYARESAILSVPSNPTTIQRRPRRRVKRQGALGLGATVQRKRSTLGKFWSNPKNIMVTPPRVSTASSVSPAPPYAILRSLIGPTRPKLPEPVITPLNSALPSPSSSVLEGCIRATSLPVAGPSSIARPSSRTDLKADFDDLKIHCDNCDRYIPFDIYDSHCRWCRNVSVEL
ncbi:hypothetical protein M422DRAFT_256196 [Sphaerobolus stellatus SS14]|uniref:Uncharacterized protein n=1 Tax=Sphaerobolus stellatus (strain SS14) TaxID=990650 RepID=A0A0C9VRZ7_SPHS4|nr:hypothetical protein M422DRAFT_256196 [Sphaerobolus stellatus SS14]